MAYKSVLLGVDTYNRVSTAKRRLEQRTKHKLSYGDLFDEVFGKRMEFLNIDDELRDYISSFSRRLAAVDYISGALLFGSVAKGHGYDRYSDIDLLIVVADRSMASKAMDYVHEIKGRMEKERSALAARRLPSFVSPLVLDEAQLRSFRPLYLDFLDYGIVLFERNNALTDFLNSMRGIKHWREFRPYEVLRWKT